MLDRPHAPVSLLRIVCSSCGHGMSVTGEAERAPRSFRATCPRCLGDGVYSRAELTPWPRQLH